MRKFKIVGLERGNNGRHCVIHHATSCGSVVAVGDMIMLEKYVLKDREDTAKVMKIADRYPTYYIAFLPQSLLKHFNLLY